jgi:beta-phosphoglucomutase-like phosphatase (HAD superfamily)
MRTPIDVDAAVFDCDGLLAETEARAPGTWPRPCADVTYDSLPHAELQEWMANCASRVLRG